MYHFSSQTVCNTSTIIKSQEQEVETSQSGSLVKNFSLVRSTFLLSGYYHRNYVGQTDHKGADSVIYSKVGIILHMLDICSIYDFDYRMYS